MKGLLWVILVGALVGSKVQAKIQIREVDYLDGTVELQGTLVYDDSAAGRRPGVLIFPEWKGPTSYEQGRAEELAQLGYVAFVADVYGKGVRPTTPDECLAQATIYRSDRKLMRKRAQTAFDTLKNQERVDPARIAAIGFCFGGTVALELARRGANLAGVVSFHGALDTPNPEDAKNIQAKILVLHGDADPTMSPQVISRFENELRKAGTDWQFITYGGARHSFSNPAAGTNQTAVAAYNEKAARRSWEAMKGFFREIFGEK